MSRELFDALNLEPRLTLSRETVEQSWRELSRTHHPDVGGGDANREKASRINKARGVLQRPAGLLGAWLAAKGGETPQRGTAVLSDRLMHLFSQLNATLREADCALDRYRRADSRVARSLASADGIRAQTRVQERLGEITTMTTELVARFPELEDAGNRGDFSAAGSVLGELKFLEKWASECQQRLVALIALD